MAKVTVILKNSVQLADNMAEDEVTRLQFAWRKFLRGTLETNEIEFSGVRYYAIFQANEIAMISFE